MILNLVYGLTGWAIGTAGTLIGIAYYVGGGKR